jgi:hypothetical protein
MALRYLGHVIVNGQKARMADYVGQPRSTRCDVPVIQLIGTSMECGKTTAGRATIRLLKQRGLRVAGAKLTGVARYHDIQSMRDAGADFVLDFVDVGLPSSLLPPPEFAGCVDHMLGLIADQSVDVAVVEMGASPMEPYNGEVAMERLRDQVQFTILAATDLYAALGAIDHLSVKPDLIVGRVASTSAGITIVEHETGIPTINPLDPESTAGLEALLARTPVWRRLAGRGG